MARLIDADALKKGLEDWYCAPERCNSYNGVRCRACALDDALNAIDDAPTVDPVIHAKWIFDRPHHYRCSACNAMWGDSSIMMTHCPGCGAEMDPHYELIGNDGKLKVFNTDTGKFEVTEDEDTETGK